MKKSVINLLKELQNEGLHIKEEEYNRITAKTKDNFNLFISDEEEVITPIQNLVVSEDKLNISLRTMTKGRVTLNPLQAKKLDLDNEIESVKFRNQTIVKNGKLNVDRLTVLIDDNTKNKLEDIGYELNLIGEQSYKDKNYIRAEINLEKLDIIGDNKKTTEDILNLVLERDVKLAEIKVLKHFIKELEDKKDTIEIQGIEYTQEQIELLKEHGVNRNGVYSGIQLEKEIDPNKYNIVKTMEFQIKGQSSVPSVNAVMKRIEDGSNLNNIQQTIAEFILDYNDNTEKELLEKLKTSENRLQEIKLDLLEIRMYKTLKDMEEFEDVDIDKKGNKVYTGTQGTLIIKTGNEKIFV